MIVASYLQRSEVELLELGLARTGISSLRGRLELYESGARHLVPGAGDVPCSLFECTKDELELLGRSLPGYTLTVKGLIHVYV